MKDSTALRRYLDRHIEPYLPEAPQLATPWENTLVVPAYREQAGFLARLAASLANQTPTLVIVVLNRPDSDKDRTANLALRDTLSALPPATAAGCWRLGTGLDIYCLDLEQASGATPAAQGVGLARKAGCDLALKWAVQGAIRSPWIATTDADATLPGEYFSRLTGTAPDVVAAVFPFHHAPGKNQACADATALYELRLHQYVLGLERAGSPYAYHSMGSALAVKTLAYAQVRGFPKRAGGEDFYSLNKLCKLGPVARLRGDTIALQSRVSPRVPFGTGPAVEKILRGGDPAKQRLFYHPELFTALGAVLAIIEPLREEAGEHIAQRLTGRGLAPELADACDKQLQAMGIVGALEHCRRQGRSPAQFTRQFHQWFDGFRTLKFIHGLREQGWPDQSLQNLEPQFWPAPGSSVRQLREGIWRHWGWRPLT